MTLQLYDFGGSGPTLLMSHATGFCGQIWEPMAETLRAQFHCVAFDFRAHGRSTRPEGRALVWSGFADDVLAVVDALSDGSPVAAIGHSMGGTALALAEVARPGTIAKAWTYEPILFSADLVEEEPSVISKGARRRRASFPSRQEALDRYRAKPPLNLLDERALQAYIEHGFADEPDGSVTLRCRPQDEAETFDNHNSGARQLVGELKIPFVVAASGDGLRPAIAVTEAAAEFSNLELVTYDDLTHFGPLQDPERIAGDVVAWMARSPE